MIIAELLKPKKNLKEEQGMLRKKLDEKML